MSRPFSADVDRGAPEPRIVLRGDVTAAADPGLPDAYAEATRSGATSVPGVWAAGNVANPRAQVITAAGEGSAAAIALNAALVQEDVRAAVALRQDEREDGGGMVRTSVA